MGLRGEDFQIQEDGKKQDGHRTSAASGGRCASRSPSTSARACRTRSAKVEAALRHFIDLLEPEDEILVLTFNDSVDVVQDFTSDRNRLGHVLNMLEPAGATASSTRPRRRSSAWRPERRRARPSSWSRTAWTR
jgi:hypothetical protein